VQNELFKKFYFLFQVLDLSFFKSLHLGKCTFPAKALTANKRE
jgi:hypothetical protein